MPFPAVSSGSPPAPPRIARCGRERAAEILALFNHAIVHTTALYDLEPRPPAFMEGWFAAKEKERLPVLGAVDADGSLAGFATYGPFRPFAGYRHTREHSVYVRADRQRAGVGRALLSALVSAARENGVRTLVGVIDADNAASLALHRDLGFASVGVLRSAGRKFDRWLDVELVQLVLAGPASPDADRMPVAAAERPPVPAAGTDLELDFFATTETSSAPASGLEEEVGLAWGLPLGRVVQVSLRRGPCSTLRGRLELAAAPDYPWQPARPLSLAIAGVGFTSSDLESWTIV